MPPSLESLNVNFINNPLSKQNTKYGGSTTLKTPKSWYCGWVMPLRLFRLLEHLRRC